MDAEPLLSVRGLSIGFGAEPRLSRIVRGVDFSLTGGSTLCLVGESGCGKSITAMALLGLQPAGARVAGQVRFEGREMIGASERALRRIRGARIGMIFQEPMSSLNPTMTVGEQIAEPLRIHQGLSRSQARARATALMERVRIPDASRRLDEYPFTFSGGMRQRVMIALAIACSPALLIADEPTTALDVTVQAEILALLRELQREHNLALLMITHDLGVVAEIADRVAVMYAGRIVETGSIAAIFERPEHPYTIGLLGALPSGEAGRRLTPIEGRVPSPADPMTGCRFSPRCPFSVEPCTAEEPPLRPMPGGEAACWQAPLA